MNEQEIKQLFDLLEQLDADLQYDPQVTEFERMQVQQAIAIVKEHIDGLDRS